MAVFSSFGQVEVVYTLKDLFFFLLVFDVAVPSVFTYWKPYSLVAVVPEINFFVCAKHRVAKFFIESVVQVDKALLESLVVEIEEIGRVVHVFAS